MRKALLTGVKEVASVRIDFVSKKATYVLKNGHTKKADVRVVYKLLDTGKLIWSCDTAVYQEYCPVSTFYVK